MNKEDKHIIMLAKKELSLYWWLLHELKINFEEAKTMLKAHGVDVTGKEDIYTKEHKQIDCFGSFVGFTLVERKREVFIDYGWALNGYNTDLYGDNRGNFKLNY